MTLTCKETGFPISCPHCGGRSGRPNGFRNTVAKGKVQQVRCASCGHQWSFSKGDRDWLFSGRRIHVSIEDVLRAIALMTLGAPMSRVEKLVGLKGETIKTWFEWIVRENRWEAVGAELAERYQVPEYDLSEFHTSIILAKEFGDRSAFHSWSKQFRKSDPRDRVKSMRLMARIVGCPMKSLMVSLGCGRGRKARRLRI